MENESSATRTRAVRQYWLKSETRKPWWPGGLLPLLGLLLVFGYGLARTAPHIQSEVQAEVAAHLKANDVAITEVDANGQHVSVRAKAPDVEKTHIHALAASTNCKTWVGRLPCPTAVDVAIDAPPVLVPASYTAAATAAAVVTRHAHNFAFDKSATALTLTGEVPSDAQRMRIVERARSHADNVIDQLAVTDREATEQYPLAAERALAVLDKFVQGRALWTDGTLDADGVASATGEPEVRSVFNDPVGQPKLGKIQIRVAHDAGECNKRFHVMLAESTISFRTSSAQIDEGNEALLQRLAQLAGECPGNITIAGHTDSRGDSVMNRQLSLARANAVRDALIGFGVKAERLNAQGFGAAQPISDNETAQGRARNRRIVIAIDELT